MWMHVHSRGERHDECMVHVLRAQYADMGRSAHGLSTVDRHGPLIKMTETKRHNQFYIIPCLQAENNYRQYCQVYPNLTK